MPSSESASNTRFWRLVAMLLLILAVCGFGAVTLCGGVFTAVAASGGEYADGIWIISLPSLLIGGWLLFICARQLRRVWRTMETPPPEA